MALDLKPRSKGLPLAVGDDFFPRLALYGGQLLTLFLAFLLLWLFVRDAHAETASERIFGRWERVTPETILKPVPDWMPTGTPGSVTNEYRRRTLQEDGPAPPGRPNSSPRSTTPEQVAAH